MGQEVKLNFGKANQEKFSVPDEHTRKINAGNQIFKSMDEKGAKAGMPKADLPVDDSKSKQISGVVGSVVPKG